MSIRKHIIFLLLFICFRTTLNSQNIKGTVLDNNTDGPIDYALVYFNGTFVSTHTDQKGYLELDISKFNSMPLTISALGYYSVTLNDFPTDKPLLIHLTLKVFELNEIVVSAKSTAKARESLSAYRSYILQLR